MIAIPRIDLDNVFRALLHFPEELAAKVDTGKLVELVDKDAPTVAAAVALLGARDYAGLATLVQAKGPVIVADVRTALGV